jgi:hypothetical protein
VIVTDVKAATDVVVTLNVLLVAPAATVALAGVVENVLLSDRVTTAPPVGAGPFKVIVPVEGLPPTTLAGFMTKADTAGGLMVNPAVSVEPL